MKPRELSEKSVEDLDILLNEKKIVLGKLRFTAPTKQPKNVKEIKEIRRDIARILTIKKIKQEIHE